MEDFSSSVSADTTSSAAGESLAGASTGAEVESTGAIETAPQPATPESVTPPPETVQDGGVAPAPIVPADDTDLQDKPGVEGIRNLRQAYRALENDIKPVREIATTVETLGGLDVVRQSTEMVNSIFSETPQNFWASLAGESPQATANLIDQVFTLWPDYIVGKVQEMGLIPQSQAPAAQSTAIEPAELEKIPQQFHDLYKALPAATREGLQYATEEERNFNLSQFAKADAAEKASQQALQAVQQQQQEAVQKQKESLFNDVGKATWAGVESQLGEKLKLSGDPEIDGLLVSMMRNLAENELVNDPAIKPLADKMAEHIDKLERRQAIGLAANLQAHGANRITKYINTLNKVFDGYRRFQASQRNEATGRIEPPQGGGNQQQNQSRTLPPNAGQFDKENLRQISRNIFGG